MGIIIVGYVGKKDTVMDANIVICGEASEVMAGFPADSIPLTVTYV